MGFYCMFIVYALDPNCFQCLSIKCSFHLIKYVYCLYWTNLFYWCCFKCCKFTVVFSWGLLVSLFIDLFEKTRVLSNILRIKFINKLFMKTLIKIVNLKTKNPNQNFANQNIFCLLQNPISSPKNQIQKI